MVCMTKYYSRTHIVPFGADSQSISSAEDSNCLNIFRNKIQHDFMKHDLVDPVRKAINPIPAAPMNRDLRVSLSQTPPRHVSRSKTSHVTAGNSNYKKSGKPMQYGLICQLALQTITVKIKTQAGRESPWWH